MFVYEINDLQLQTTLENKLTNSCPAGKSLFPFDTVQEYAMLSCQSYGILCDAAHFVYLSLRSSFRKDMPFLDVK